MQHEVAVRELHRAADLRDQAHARTQVEPLPVAGLGERGAIDVLHREPRHAGVGEAAVDEVRDVRMAQPRQDLALAQEALVQGRAAAAHQLQRDLLRDVVDPLGQVHRAHAALAEQAQDAVAAGDDRAGRQPGVDRRHAVGVDLRVGVVEQPAHQLRQFRIRGGHARELGAARFGRRLEQE